MSATAQVAGQTAWDADAIAASVERSIRSLMGKRWHDATPRDLFVALALACREMLIEGWFATRDRVRQADAKRLYYLSVEFLIGRSLQSSLENLGVLDEVERAFRRLGVDWEAVVESEPDAALGNGGLGRLAACFLDSLATLDLPGFGYGINYDYGLFRQAIEHGHQREYPEGWQRPGAAWLIERPERACLVPVYGRAGQRPRDRFHTRACRSNGHHALPNSRETGWSRRGPRRAFRRGRRRRGSARPPVRRCRRWGWRARRGPGSHRRR